MNAPRLFIHVQHLLGTGHLRRAATLARAFAGAGWHVEIASGGFPVTDLDTGGAILHQLPPLRATGPDFDALVGEDGEPINDAWRGARRDHLLALFEAAGPDVLMVEMFPFGRRQLRFELLPLLDAAARRGARVVCSVRDVLVKKGPEKEAAAAALIREHFDAVLVHGDPEILPLAATFGPAAEIEEWLHYTGYIAGPAAAREGPGAPGWNEIVVSAGGSAAGRHILDAALEAHAGARKEDETWRLLVGGRDGAEHAAALRARAADATGLEIEPVRPDFRRLLANCAVSISQAGYNTVMDIVQSGARGVLIPYAKGEETEQTERAGAFCALGYGVYLPEPALSGERLADAVAAARRLPGPVRPVRLGGEAATVELVADLLQREQGASP